MEDFKEQDNALNEKEIFEKVTTELTLIVDRGNGPEVRHEKG